MPEALAWRTKSEFRSVAAAEHSTRAALLQPRRPSNKKVTSAETRGATFSGMRARMVISKKSQGRDKNRSVMAIAARDQIPPRYPARPPIRAANRVDSNAAAGASKKGKQGPSKK